MTEMTENPSFFSTSVKHGLIMGIVMIIISLITQLGGLTTNIAVMGLIFFLSIAIYALASYRAIKEHRDVNLGGHINFGSAFVTGLVAALTTGLIASVFTIVYINFIDPSSIEQQMEMAADMMEKMGADDDAIDKAMSDAEKNAGNPISLLLQGVGSALFFGLISSLILAAVMKKEETYS